MDENGLLSEIFETRYFGTTRCSIPYILLFAEKMQTRNTFSTINLHFYLHT